MDNKRIVSLLPAATEIVCALGLEQQLVGRSHECDFPEEIKALPVCSRATVLDEGSSKAIDTQVKESLLKALSLYEVDAAMLASLQPDFVITQDQCEVCAVNSKEVEAVLGDLVHKEIQMLSLQPKTLTDILKDIEQLGAVLGVEEKAAEVLEDLQTRIDIIEHKVKYVKERQKLACIEWLEPLMTAGNWTPELIQLAGASPVLSTNGEHSPFITWEDLAAATPDILVIAPCGFSMARTLSEIRVLTEHPLWHTLPAVQKGRVYVADGNQYFNRSGPRIVDTLEILAEIIQANQFYFGMEGSAWVKFG